MGVLLVFFFMINVFVIISMANLKKGSLTDIVWLAPDQFGVKMFQPVEGRGWLFHQIHQQVYVYKRKCLFK